MALYRIIRNTYENVHCTGKLHDKTFFLEKELKVRMQLYVRTVLLLLKLKLDIAKFFTCTDGIRYDGYVHDYVGITRRTRIFK